MLLSHIKTAQSNSKFVYFGNIRYIKATTYDITNDTFCITLPIIFITDSKSIDAIARYNKIYINIQYFSSFNSLFVLFLFHIDIVPHGTSIEPPINQQYQKSYFPCYGKYITI